jgi:hypothetical protein
MKLKIHRKNTENGAEGVIKEITQESFPFESISFHRGLKQLNNPIRSKGHLLNTLSSKYIVKGCGTFPRLLYVRPQFNL